MASKTTQLKISKMGWSVWSENPGQFAPIQGGQFAPNLGGQIERIFQTYYLRMAQMGYYIPLFWFKAGVSSF